jgi:exodeoxyribonuclease (lambda-induced)
MKFEYFAGEQRTEPWFQARIGKVTASNLYRWLAVSKRDGSPLKARHDYERELMFERTFNTIFEKWSNSAMQEGIDFEAFARQEYERITGKKVTEVGCWFNEFFAASPDGGVDDEGLLEIKWLKDTNWTEVLQTQAPYVGSGADHWKQCQGQLFASKRKWCDYAAGNLNTKKIIILRVLPDKKFFKELEESLKQPISVEKFNLKNVHDLKLELPEGATPPSDGPDFGF